MDKIPVDGDATGGEHSNGSAVCYQDTATPSNRPDGATALASNAIDKGRLWIDDNKTQVPIKRWNGSAWVTAGMSPSVQAAAESIIHANGLIEKSGYTAIGAVTGTVTFAAAFPTACRCVVLTLVENGTATTDSITLDAQASKTAFTWRCPNAARDGFYWIAKGY